MTPRSPLWSWTPVVASDNTPTAPVRARSRPIPRERPRRTRPPRSGTLPSGAIERGSWGASTSDAPFSYCEICKRGVSFWSSLNDRSILTPLSDAAGRDGGSRRRASVRRGRLGLAPGGGAGADGRADGRDRRCVGPVASGAHARDGGLREADGEHPRDHAIRRSSGPRNARAWSRSASGRPGLRATEEHERLSRFAQSIRRRRSRT